MTEPDGQAKPVILLVEDEEDTADLVALIMEGDGYKVFHAADGRQALRLIASMPPPSLVLLDMQLPYADGMKLLEQIRYAGSSWKRVPVVMLTADNAARDVREALALGANDYILKPFKRKALLERIRRFRPEGA